MSRQNKGTEDLNTLLGSGKDPMMGVVRGNVGSEQSVSGKSINVQRGNESGMTATNDNSNKDSSPMSNTNLNGEGFQSQVSSEPRSEFNPINNARARSDASEAKRRPGFSEDRTRKGTSG